jgi:cytochrome P450
MLETDPPRHRELRNICNKRFSARGVGAYEEFIRDVARSVLDRALEKQEFDFVVEVAKELPIRFLCAIFTVPQEDAPMLIRWGDAMIGNQDPEFTHAVVDQVDTEEYRNLPFRSPIALEMFEYAHRQRDLRLEEPQDDVIAALTVAQREGVLTEREFDNYFGLLMIAGNETTRHTISHGMLAMIEHPDQMRRLTEDPSLIPGAVEEILRHDGPTQFTQRIAREDVPLGGKTVGRGQLVFLFLAAANRDPAHFPDPDRLDVTRAVHKHVALGLGHHFCLGAPLARLEAQIAFETILRRLPKLRLATNKLVYRDNFNLRGLQSLPVVFR